MGSKRMVNFNLGKAGYYRKINFFDKNAIFSILINVNLFTLSYEAT